jgi:structural maintenance of chromosome 3 (chondroitin sulfate proteoglycan 6)
VKEIIRYKSCLAVRVSFTGSADVMKKWTDFSGGERTVIAISMVLALQRCEPAPFYVLDEIDSALDAGFVRKIAELLANDSQKNECQYFVSSFKEDMLNFPEDICNYYMVECQNRVSQVEKISRSRAIDAIQSIAIRK